MSRQFTSNWLMSYEARNTPKGRLASSVDAVEVESGLHYDIIKECKRRGWKYVHSAMNRPTTCGEGVCDFIIYADGGRMFHVECKSRSGKLSMEQLAFIAWIEKLGHKCHVVDNFQQFLEVIQ